MIYSKSIAVLLRELVTDHIVKKIFSVKYG